MLLLNHIFNFFQKKASLSCGKTRSTWC